MRSHKTLARVCATAVCLAAAQVHAQGVSLQAGGDFVDQVEHPRGVYTGVKPGGDEAPGLGVKPGTMPAAITWPGFQMRPDGSSRVFVQMTTQVDVRTVANGNKILVDFGNVTVAGVTNRYPLYTSFFNTPVTRVELRRANKRTIMELTLRAAVEPSVSSEHAKSGYYFVYFDFPAGNYRSGASPAAPAAVDTLPDSLPLDPPAPSSSSEATRSAPSHLDVQAGGQAQAGASASGSAELKSGTGKLEAKTKGKAKTQGKIGF